MATTERSAPVQTPVIEKYHKNSQSLDMKGQDWEVV
jgi:hypothetical protein